ncbi:DUF6399 domain-containing protein [Desulfobacter hydrogenophilus]|uniref:DUF6399 domain-containing protein n=1 Tax=Desulfobacter hydrogenophilus TaxID=2291 RepID=UPI0034D305EE
MQHRRTKCSTIFASPMKGLTVIHNFHLKRPDGTTAAERFFENKPINMFEWLVENMPLPARPRSRIKMVS